MSWYDKIQKELDIVNETDIKIEIDYISENEIIFSIYDTEVSEDVLTVIEQVLDYIKEYNINLTGINYYSNLGCFNLEYKTEVGEDE